MVDPPEPVVADPPAPPEVDALIGRRLADRFQVQSLIAAGGMGRVYRAEQQPLGRLVALKVLRSQNEAWDVTSSVPELSGATASAIPDTVDRAVSMRQRFLREASICAQLKHPNTITIFDYGCTDDNVYFIAMELLEGRTLDQAIAQDGHFAPARALRIIAQVARSLREAHGLGVIHRDLKPGNVFLVTHDDDPDFVKVLDFGLVKEVEPTGQAITRTGFFVGSPCYMAPEQIRGQATDFRTDIYSLGVILYQMLTARVPFKEKTAMDTVVAHLQKKPPTLSTANPAVSVPAPIEAVVMRAIAKQPGARFASMEELCTALQQAAVSADLPFAGGSTASGAAAIQVQSQDLEELPTRPHRRPRRVPLGLIGAGLFLAGTLIGAYAWLRGTDTVAPVPPPPPVAVSLTSEPAGAAVWVAEERLCAATPCRIEWPASRRGGVYFRFALTGYLDKTIEGRITDKPVEIGVSLVRLPTGTPEAAAAAEAGKKKPRRPATKPPKGKKKRKGYKDNPY